MRAQSQVQNNIQLRKNRKAFRINNYELLVENFSEIQKPIIQQPKFMPPICPSCERNNWTIFSHVFINQTPDCEYIIRKQKHQIDKKIS